MIMIIRNKDNWLKFKRFIKNYKVIEIDKEMEFYKVDVDIKTLDDLKDLINDLTILFNLPSDWMGLEIYTENGNLELCLFDNNY